ncbi:MAG: chemotaxis protein CheW [Rhodomicrobium sp.]|nr:chemotaxis protein CheW [Rhodomicrobium sp.]
MSQVALKKEDPGFAGADDSSYFTVFVGGEIFGLPVEHTHTIFRITGVTSVPLSPGDITGLVNLRGKIVTAVCLRRRLRMTAGNSFQNALAIGIEHRGENFALIVDEVGDVLSLGKSSEIPIPSHFDPQRARLTSKLYRTGKLLIPVLDIDALFTFQG